jgi:hypothetical protein
MVLSCDGVLLDRLPDARKTHVWLLPGWAWSFLDIAQIMANQFACR